MHGPKACPVRRWVTPGPFRHMARPAGSIFLTRPAFCHDWCLSGVTASATQCYVTPVSLTGGELFVWGSNGYVAAWDIRGALGTGDTLSRDTPTQIWSPNGEDITSVYMGGYSSAFLAGMPHVQGGHGYGGDLVECGGVGWIGARGAGPEVCRARQSGPPSVPYPFSGRHLPSVCWRSGSSREWLAAFCGRECKPEPKGPDCTATHASIPP